MSTFPTDKSGKNTGVTPMTEKSGTPYVGGMASALCRCRNLCRRFAPAPYIGGMNKKEEIYTTKEIAELFKVSIYAVRTWAARGLPGAVKIGKSWRFTRESVDYLKFSGVV